MARVSPSAPTLLALGRVLKALRQAKGLTQEQLSFRSGLTTALISDSENGKRNLSFQSIGRLLAALDVSWEDFGRSLSRREKRP
jgi:transcriptional regulator with XRE-family HTH domain